MKLDSAAVNQHRLKSLDAEAVESRGAVEQHRAFLDRLFQNFPHLGAVALDEAARAFHIGRIIVCHQLGDHKRPIQLKRHVLRQTALV